MIKIDGISVKYGKNYILKDVSTSMTKDKVTVVLGPNGCGKTTLLKAITGLVSVSKGEIFIDEKAIDAYKSNEMAKKIAFMPQTRHVPDMTVKEFLMCARYPYMGMNKTPKETDKEAVLEAMKSMGLEDYSDRMIKKMSGGERQKVYFAFMLAQQTDVILLDEPTTYLDVERQFEIFELIQLMKRQGKTVIMVVHDIAHGMKYADDIIVMNDGSVVYKGTADEVYNEAILDKIYNVKVRKVVCDGSEEYVIVK